MARLFVVDTENTNDYSFINKYNISEQDEIVLFISDKMKAVKADGCIELLSSDATIKIEKIENGEKNALDFQLVVYITEKALCHSYDNIYIVSKDHGYRPVIGYIKRKFDKNITIISSGRESNISNTQISKGNSENDEIKISKDTTNLNNVNSVKKKENVASVKSLTKPLGSPNDEIEKVILGIVPAATSVQINKILELRNKKTPLVDVHTKLLKMFKNDGKEIYKSIKPYMLTK